MAGHSLRTVLTIWNGVALGSLLGVFGVAIVLANQNQLRVSIDDDLTHQAERAVRLGMPGAGPEEGGGPPPGELRPDDPMMGGGMRPPRPDALPEVYRDAGRLADIRRPRFFGRDGSVNPHDQQPPFSNAILQDSLHGRRDLTDVIYQGQRLRLISWPILRDGRVDGVVQIAIELRSEDLLWTTQVRTLAFLLPLAVLAAGFGAYSLTGRTLKPIRNLTRAAANISHSDLSKRLEVSGEDEIGELAQTFNGMLGRLQTSFAELEEAYGNLSLAYEQQQRFTADASHELRTPLTRLRLATSAALENGQTPEEMRRALETADRAATSMTRLVQDLLTLARADAGQLPLSREPADLRVIVADALEDAAGNREIDTAFDDRPLMILADAENLKRVVINLVENAIRYTPPAGTIRVETVRAEGKAIVVVRDTGSGIAPEHLPHLFERFYRADKARTRSDGGSGLGLAICKNLVEAQGGRIEIESSVGVGTTVRTIFPLFSSRPGTQMESS